MSKWNSADLEKIIQADDLHIAPFRADGRTYGTPTWIWCVSEGGELFVRAYNGQSSRWYQAAISQKKGKIEAANKTFQVSFEAADPMKDDAIDEAYRQKYSGSPYLNSMISERARQATVKVIPAQ
ncbi:MAG: hypothetical protein CMF59_15760 [Leptospiraceae bacterium]|nr:hypothetical protein [Leptospiraceae bacterium]